MHTRRSAQEILIHPIVGPLPSVDYEEAQGPIVADFLEGGFFGGSTEAVVRYSEDFYRLHDLWAPRFFIGKDQQIFNAMFFLSPGRVATNVYGLLGEEDFFSHCGDKWFYYQYWLSDPLEAAAQLRFWQSDRCELSPVTDYWTMKKVQEKPDFE